MRYFEADAAEAFVEVEKICEEKSLLVRAVLYSAMQPPFGCQVNDGLTQQGDPAMFYQEPTDFEPFTMAGDGGCGGDCGTGGSACDGDCNG